MAISMASQAAQSERAYTDFKSRGVGERSRLYARVHTAQKHVGRCVAACACLFTQAIATAVFNSFQQGTTTITCIDGLLSVDTVGLLSLFAASWYFVKLWRCMFGLVVVHDWSPLNRVRFFIPSLVV